MAEAGLLAGLELVARLVLVLVHVLQEVRSQGRREWMRKIGVDHNIQGQIVHQGTTEERGRTTTRVLQDLRNALADMFGLPMLPIPQSSPVRSPSLMAAISTSQSCCKESHHSPSVTATKCAVTSRLEWVTCVVECALSVRIVSL